MPAPWDQRIGEPGAAYVRFLYYRNLGRGRSLGRAYYAYLKAEPTENLAQSEQNLVASNRIKSHQIRPTGQWTHDCSHYAWVARAIAWDEHQANLLATSHGPKWTAYLDGLMTKGFETLADPDFEVKTVEDLLLIFQACATYLPPEVMRRYWQTVAGLAVPPPTPPEQPQGPAIQVPAMPEAGVTPEVTPEPLAAVPVLAPVLQDPTPAGVE